MTNYQRAKKKVLKIEQKADTFLDKLKKLPITALVVGAVAVAVVVLLVL